MDEVEHTVAREGGDHDPERPPETDDRESDEHRASEQLTNERICGLAHDREERVEEGGSCCRVQDHAAERSHSLDV